MRHFLLLSLAVSTLAVIAAAGKKLEELSPAAREFLKKRDFFNWRKKHNEIYNKNRKLSKNAQLPLPPAPTGPSASAARRAYGKIAREKELQKRLSDFNGSNPTAFNELFENGYIRD
ncbi:hypothetical protein PRIPAC_78754 [Pristionchus pacificus]|uniref:Uncharacterized protein n=1 Tax=Pristionchus pacificus TaxID=54126 RepID=A0A2A6BW26_PRIPA|nr:hypothetical protein PRIPAC_78754 [Pristionchus pacificus]|eukprot:PDM69993.1 hypothetical protein PRIPAC_49205 [Pristionchus pacificus]